MFKQYLAKAKIRECRKLIFDIALVLLILAAILPQAGWLLVPLTIVCFGFWLYLRLKTKLF